MLLPLGTLVAAAVVSSAPPEGPILASFGILDALPASSPQCVGRSLRALPFTDATLPNVGGNVPRSSRFFRSNYERPLPTVGNALRRSIDDYEKTRRYATTSAAEAVFYEQAQVNVKVDLDYLDLLRNSWLDSIQALEADADDDEPLDDDLRAARAAGRDYLHAARLDPNATPVPHLDCLCAEVVGAVPSEVPR